MPNLLSFSRMATPDPDLLSTWQFELPEHLIASRPAASRDDSRLMILNRRLGTIEHAWIRDLPDRLNSEDLLVFNNTQVIPARLFGYRQQTGGRWEGLYVESDASGNWILLCETRGKLQPGERIQVVPADCWQRDDLHPQSAGSYSRLTLTLVSRTADGSWLAQPDDSRPAVQLLEENGSLPLPPYMGRKIADEADRERYQTTYASQPGAVAAPTAGLHFTPQLLQRCGERGVRQTELTLHVGPGTFRPVTAERLSEHVMHEEWCRLPAAAAAAIRGKSAAGRLVAVGTTSVRTLEAAAAATGAQFPTAWEGRTALFIRPGYEFRAVQGLLTNFHLPGSTLLALVAAFAGFDLVMDGYLRAIEKQYRFYSYGDAMLIL
ncbi:MAG: tRNA preQ1(34) S-adenosylmethionine ribosyltransferase-isomerase QueA [Planctomyces sp.]